MWQRIVFNVAVSNTDDHLRNHGFLLTEHGWTLSPMFDVNPDIYGNALSLGISEIDNNMSFELVVDTATYYDINIHDARSIVAGIQKTIGGNWRALAVKYGLSKESINRMEPAFSID